MIQSQIKKIAVIGLGSVGKGLAFGLADNNFQVVAVTRRGHDGFQDLSCFIDHLIETKKTEKTKQEIFSNITWSSSFKENTSEVDLVIECMKEDLNEKQYIFQKMDAFFPKEIILSSVTSSLSINEISRFMRFPQRMIGLHFFNPPYLMKLVEVVPCAKTSSGTLEFIKPFMVEFQKTVIVTADQPGFIVNRLIFAMINEAINMLSEGKVSAEGIDLAVKLGANHPMGPLHLADFIGLDVCLIILENLYQQDGTSRYRPNPLLIQKVKNNHLGRKTGKGFFDYGNFGSPLIVSKARVRLNKLFKLRT
jgi:3-hydroxybutyryl-CoA dehydrogenase